MSQPPYLQPGESAVLYDGVCKLCNGWVNFMLRHHVAREVRFASVQSEEGKALLRWAGLPQENVSTIVYIADQQHWLRAQAVFRVMHKLSAPGAFSAYCATYPIASVILLTIALRSIAINCLAVMMPSIILSPTILVAFCIKLNPNSRDRSMF